MGVPREGLTHALAVHIPQLDRSIKAATGQGASIGGKGQCEYPVGMACEHARGSFWLCLLHLPQANLHVEAATGEQAAIGTPGKRIHRAAMANECLQERAPLDVPEPYGSIISAAGERASMGGKGEALNALGGPIRPEQGALLY